MTNAFLGFYWYRRTSTLRDYSNLLREVLILLRGTHPSFKDLEWVGDGKRKRVLIDPDMRNLDEIIYQYSWSKKHILGEQNSDGSPTWSSESLIGYQMVLDSGRSTADGGVSVSMCAGDPGNITPNNVIVGFPAPRHTDNCEVYTYEKLLILFAGLAGLTNPNRGLLSSYEFSKLICDEGPYKIGWLTYFSDERCASLSNQFPTERIDLPGTLFSLGKNSIFDASHNTVSLGIKLLESLNQIDVN